MPYQMLIFFEKRRAKSVKKTFEATKFYEMIGPKKIIVHFFVVI
jgi:hypothetical protein